PDRTSTESAVPATAIASAASAPADLAAVSRASVRSARRSVMCWSLWAIGPSAPSPPASAPQGRAAKGAPAGAAGPDAIVTALLDARGAGVDAAVVLARVPRGRDIVAGRSREAAPRHAGAYRMVFGQQAHRVLRLHLLVRARRTEVDGAARHRNPPAV